MAFPVVALKIFPFAITIFYTIKEAIALIQRFQINELHHHNFAGRLHAMFLLWSNDMKTAVSTLIIVFWLLIFKPNT